MITAAAVVTVLVVILLLIGLVGLVLFGPMFVMADYDKEFDEWRQKHHGYDADDER